MSRPLRFDPIAEAARQWDEHWGTGATPAMSAVTSIMRVHQILISRLNAVLERPGYVERLPHEQDRRTILARLTDRGRQVAVEATRELNEMRFGTAPLGRGELDGLMETLRRVRVDAGDFEDEEAVSAASREP